MGYQQGGCNQICIRVHPWLSILFEPLMHTDRRGACYTDGF